MRILIIADGVDRSEAHLYAGLRAAGYAPDILAAPDVNRAHLAECGLEFEPFGIRHRLDRRAVKRLRSRLADGGHKLIYAPLNRPLAVALQAAKACRIPVIGYRGTIGHISRFDPGSWLTYLHPRVSRIICVAEAVRRYLLAFGLPAQRLVTIPKGHDPDWYAADGCSFDRAAAGIPDNAFLIGFAGNIRPVKGVEILLKALANLPEDLPVHLLLAGEIRDPLIRGLAEQPALRRRAHFLGHRPEAWRISGICDVFVMPSLAREGLPRAVIEAMAQGVPALVSDAGGLPELVRDGQDGLVVPAGNHEALGNAVIRLYNNPALRTRMGASARQRIADNFNISKTVEAYVDVFRRAIQQNDA